MFIPLRIEAISIMEALLLSIYVLFVPFRKGQANCAQPGLRAFPYVSPTQLVFNTTPTQWEVFSSKKVESNGKSGMPAPLLEQ